MPQAGGQIKCCADGLLWVGRSVFGESCRFGFVGTKGEKNGLRELWKEACVLV